MKYSHEDYDRAIRRAKENARKAREDAFWERYDAAIRRAFTRFDDERDARTQEGEGGEAKPHYGNTRLSYGLCKRFGIDMPAGAKPRDAWEALEKGTGYTHDEIMETVKKVGDTKGLKAKKVTANKTTGGKQGGVREKGAEVKPKSLRGIGAREHKHFNTLSEGQSYLSKELVVPVNYAWAKGMTAEKANRFYDAILTVAEEIGIKPNAIGHKNMKTGYMDVGWRGDYDGTCNVQYWQREFQRQRVRSPKME